MERGERSRLHVPAGKDGVMPEKNFDDEDLKAALARTDVSDGPVAFAEDGVENDTEDSK